MQNLIDKTYETARRLLEERNTLTTDHAALLRAMCQSVIELALGSIHGRYAVVAGCGLGKTSVIKAAIATLAEHGPEDVGMLVLQQRVAAGQETVEELIRMGVPAEDVVHVHSYPGGATVEQAKDARWVFATHTRAKMRDSVVPLLTYHGNPRATIIDEAIHATEATGLAKSGILAAHGWTVGALSDDRDEVAVSLCRWASGVRASIEDALQTLAKSGERETTLQLPRPDDGMGARYIARLNRLKDSAGARPFVSLIEAVAVDDRFRLVRVGEGTSGAVLQHRRVLPDELHSCLVMDAGGEIDELQGLDDGIQLAHEALPCFAQARQPSKVKDWSAVEVHWMRAPGGKHTMREQYRRRPLADVWAPREVASFVKDHLPGSWNEATPQVLICTYKVDGIGDYQRVQLAALERAGVDPRRVAFTHWGQHDASNEWQDVELVVAAGTQQLDRYHVMAWALGQMNDPRAETPPPALVSRIMRAHEAGCLYQLLGRGRCRTVEEGKARKMVFGFIHQHPETTRYLQRVIPGAQWHTWESPPATVPEHLSESLTTQVAQTIAKELRRLARAGVRIVSVRELRRRLGLEVTGRVMSNATSRALEVEPWVRDGRTLVNGAEVFASESS